MHDQISTLLQTHAEIEQKTMQKMSDCCPLQELGILGAIFWGIGLLRITYQKRDIRGFKGPSGGPAIEGLSA